jgi:hypothetical protein
MKTEILGRLPNVQIKQKAKHNHEMAVLSKEITNDEKSYLCAPRDLPLGA